jgi:hypothetical protein
MCYMIGFLNNFSFIFFLKDIILKYSNLDINELEIGTLISSKIIRFSFKNIEFIKTSMHVNPRQFVIKSVESLSFMVMCHKENFSTLQPSHLVLTCIF